MQTSFDKDQLQEKRMVMAESIIKSCIHCGLCTATCPTYLIKRDERDSPRGRIYMIKDMLENGGEASAQTTTHIDRCLTCLSCTTACPSGVDYLRLIDLARNMIGTRGKRSYKAQVTRQFVLSTLPYPKRLKSAMRMARLAKPFSGLLKKIGLGDLVSMMELMPTTLPPPGTYRGAGAAKPRGVRQRGVILLEGCVQPTVEPSINDATIRLFARNGVEVFISSGANCCGGLAYHNGAEEQAIDQAKDNIDAWHKVLGKEDIDAIVINASGCGTTVKNYSHMLEHDADYRIKAAHIVALTRDVTEFLTDYDLGPPKRWSSLQVAYHAPCSLQHAQRVIDPPRALLKKAGFGLLEINEGDICCGSAGTYNLFQPEIAKELRDRKIENIEILKPDVIATGNVGCMVQLQSGTSIPVVHTVELLDWAYGGPCPEKLKHLKDRVSDVPNPEPKTRAEMVTPPPQPAKKSFFRLRS